VATVATKVKREEPSSGTHVKLYRVDPAQLSTLKPLTLEIPQYVLQPFEKRVCLVDGIAYQLECGPQTAISCGIETEECIFEGQSGVQLPEEYYPRVLHQRWTSHQECAEMAPQQATAIPQPPHVNPIPNRAWFQVNRAWFQLDPNFQFRGRPLGYYAMSLFRLSLGLYFATQYKQNIGLSLISLATVLFFLTDLGLFDFFTPIAEEIRAIMNPPPNQDPPGTLSLMMMSHCLGPLPVQQLTLLESMTAPIAAFFTSMIPTNIPAMQPEQAIPEQDL
jgi:hypothetical protein